MHRFLQIFMSTSSGLLSSSRLAQSYVPICCDCFMGMYDSLHKTILHLHMLSNMQKIGEAYSKREEEETLLLQCFKGSKMNSSYTLCMK